METTHIDINDLPSRLAEVLTLARTGAEVIVMEDNVACAKLLPLPASQSRVPGLHVGAIECTPDFDAPLPDSYWAGER